MPGILLSGPAGGGKSQLSRRLLREANEPTVQVDFQSIVVALLGLERGPDGKFPIRPEFVLPLAEYTRRAIFSGALSQEISVVATNSDGDPARRAFLVSQLGAGASERIVDPGIKVVSARLADPETGSLDPECEKAIGRWFGRIGK